MKQTFSKIYQFTRVLEIIIGIAILIAIMISMLSLIGGLRDLLFQNQGMATFQSFLAVAFNILIGIEFLKMIFKYSVNTVIEVLLFAIARQLIVEHTTVIENFIGVASIAILFVIRKFLFMTRESSRSVLSIVCTGSR